MGLAAPAAAGGKNGEVPLYIAGQAYANKRLFVSDSDGQTIRRLR
ncbi:hypothetical protein [Deinococcus radiopugnans]|uniref:Uncharacterized protein n=1 Tax=Deinococcus radiopugnans ATCC 19172 TaxID=585398 RepID=A0ABR6NWW6_9DEIO|nr:hypothetical protein [Deinococcus radiopugnans]MBB6018544.1 hypothetical protein [Deinococcus radiopugnans ATCC 19172]